MLKNGEVKGIKVSGKIFRSLIVVANAIAKTTLLELVGEQCLDKRFVEHIKSLKISSSCFMVFLGLT